MNWLQKLIKSSQYKPMLPYSPPADLPGGGLKVDQRMNQETADEESMRNPGIDFFDAGAEGLVNSPDPDDPDLLSKYIYTEHEAEAIQKAYENKYPFIVEIVSPPMKIQEDPTIWTFQMRKALTLDWPDREIITSLYRSFMNEEYPDFRSLVKKYSSLISPERLEKLYIDYTELLNQSQAHLPVYDLHGGNVGYQNDRMVIFDLGGYEDFLTLSNNS